MPEQKKRVYYGDKPRKAQFRLGYIDDKAKKKAKKQRDRAKAAQDEANRQAKLARKAALHPHPKKAKKALEMGPENKTPEERAEWEKQQADERRETGACSETSPPSCASGTTPATSCSSSSSATST